ncbi:MAG: ankyrin repeat domain-containing protein [Bacteroidota bacterium]
MHYIFPLITIFLSCQSQSYPATTDNSVQGQNTENLEIIDGKIVKYFGYDISHLDDFVVGEYPFDMEVTKDYALCIAAEYCDLSLVKQMLEDGLDPNVICDVDHILTNAVFCDDQALDMAQQFLAKGADINGADEENNSFLAYPILVDNVELVEFILNHGGDPDQRMSEESIGCYPMHDTESVAMLELLLDRGVDIHTTCHDGRTLLHQAAKSGAREVYDYILERELIDPGIQDTVGRVAADYLR